MKSLRHFLLLSILSTTVINVQASDEVDSKKTDKPKSFRKQVSELTGIKLTRKNTNSNNLPQDQSVAINSSLEDLPPKPALPEKSNTSFNATHQSSTSSLTKEEKLTSLNNKIDAESDWRNQDDWANHLFDEDQEEQQNNSVEQLAEATQLLEQARLEALRTDNLAEDPNTALEQARAVAMTLKANRTKNLACQADEYKQEQRALRPERKQQEAQAKKDGAPAARERKIAARKHHEDCLTQKNNIAQTNVLSNSGSSSEDDKPTSRLSLRSFGDDEGFGQNQEPDYIEQAVVVVYNNLLALIPDDAKESMHVNYTQGINYTSENIAWATESSTS